MRTLFFVCLLLSILVAGCKVGQDNGTSTGQAPQITGFNPGTANPGQINIEGRIYGKNLTGILSVNLGSGVILQQFSSISESELYIFFSVLREAAGGPRDIVLTTTAGAANGKGLLNIGNNRYPEAIFTVHPTFGLKDTLFRFDASQSNDDGPIVNYKWTFGDHRQASGKIVNHKFDKAGSFEVLLQVTDNQNVTVNTSRFVDVAPSRPPLAAFNVSPTSGDLSTTFHFDGSPSRDPDGRISQWFWGFGDGKTASGEKVDHVFGSGGTFVVSLTVADNTGQPSLAQKSVAINGPGGGGPPPPPGGSECTVPANRPHTGLFGTIVSSDKPNRSIVIRLDDNTDCGNAFFKCGDFNNPTETAYYGAICRMFYLGNNTFDVRVVNSKAWPNPGDRAFLKFQTCNGSLSCP
jgi:PKD repeat protein